MMTCKDVTEHASDLLDGKMGHWERIKLRLHLLICTGCARFVAQMRATRDLTRAAAGEPRDPEEGSHIDAILARLHGHDREHGHDHG